MVVDIDSHRLAVLLAFLTADAFVLVDAGFEQRKLREEAQHRTNRTDGVAP